MDVSNEYLNKRFNVGDYARIMQTTERTKEGISEMVCKLTNKYIKQDFGCDIYDAELNISWFKSKIIKVNTAEINPININELSALCNTFIYFRDKREIEGLIKK